MTKAKPPKTERYPDLTRTHFANLSSRAQRGNLVGVRASFRRRFSREGEIATAQAPRNDSNLNSYWRRFAISDYNPVH